MARRRRLGCMIVLLSREANVNAQSSDGSTPLHQAAAVSAACTAGILFYFILFYFIILPHTMNYKQNKNDNK